VVDVTAHLRSSVHARPGSAHLAATAAAFRHSPIEYVECADDDQGLARCANFPLCQRCSGKSQESMTWVGSGRRMLPQVTKTLHRRLNNDSCSTY
jgi:hypothetical protein